MPTLIRTCGHLRRRVSLLHRLQSDPHRLDELRAADVVGSVSQTEVWIATPDRSGGWAVAQAKLAAYDVAAVDYAAQRRHMRGGEASRLVRRWGHELPPTHPAHAAVHVLAQRLGTAPRRRFVVVGIETASGDPDDASEPDDRDLAVLAAVDALLPLLSPAVLARLRTGLAAGVREQHGGWPICAHGVTAPGAIG